MKWQNEVSGFNDSNDIVISPTKKEAIHFGAEQLIALAQDSIEKRGKFVVALAGGTTPLEMYQLLASSEYRDLVDWSKVFLFWSDERAVPPDHADSNYGQTMAALAALPVPKDQIFRMQGEGDLEENARAYEALILQHASAGILDLVMLGMGDDGHTASLFPKTHGLHTKKDRLAIPNYVPQKSTWRLSLTFACINNSRHIVIYVLGPTKAAMVKRALLGPIDFDEIPIQRVGMARTKALWVLDKDAAAEIYTQA